MRNRQYEISNIVKMLDEDNIILKRSNVSKYETLYLSNSTEYSYRCKNYRKYPLCKFQMQITIEDINPTAIKLMYKGTQDHEQRNTTTRKPLPARQCVSKYAGIQSHRNSNKKFINNQLSNSFNIA